MYTSRKISPYPSRTPSISKVLWSIFLTSALVYSADFILVCIEGGPPTIFRKFLQLTNKLIYAYNWGIPSTFWEELGMFKATGGYIKRSRALECK